MRDPVIALVADIRTSHANGGEVGLLLDRVGEVGPISTAGCRALVDLLNEVGAELYGYHRDAVLGVLDEVEGAFTTLLQAQRLLDDIGGAAELGRLTWVHLNKTSG